MKSFIIIIGCALSLTIFCFTSCSKSAGTNAGAGPAAGADSVTIALSSGKWTISSLIQKTEDNTNSFAGYVFSFSAAGKLSAVKNGVEVQGTWSYTPAVTYYGSSSKNALSINTGTDNPFRRLTGTWNLVSGSSTVIKLDNPEILDDEHLQLQKQ
ncbi:MAG: hypothetical protein ABJB86_03270 [Bacteroidota bacterium]